MTRLRVAALAAATTLALAAPLAPTSATAASPGTLSGAAALAQCVTSLGSLERVEDPMADASSRTAGGKGRGVSRDTPPVTRADLDAVAPEEVGPRLMRMQTARALPSRVTIPVRVHIIRGTHRGERNVRRPAVVRSLNILNNAFAGAQSSQSAPTRYRFVLRSIDYTTRDSWYHAFNNGKADQQAKRRLSKGPAGVLNLYINRGGTKFGPPVLGWAKFPWQRAAAPKLDHVSISTVSMPGGTARGYNLGDTLVHEVGHWMGLFHTFQGGCSPSNDQVADTPAEAEPSFGCTEKDSCSAPGADPIRNFMNYSFDSCMNQFTPGQVARMDKAFLDYRLGKR